LEAYVPAQGEPYITYVSDQLFQGFGDFCGVLVSRELQDTPWYEPLVASGTIIAQRLQEMGYVGLFDLDTVVNDEGRVYLLEVNPRRTGGTHVHEFAAHVFGDDYLKKVALLSNDTLSSGKIADFDELLSVVRSFEYPMNGEQRGIFITVTSALEAHEFGCIIVGANRAEVVEIQRQLQARIVEYSQSRA
jgi:phosphoribosylglycinamide formyltransferase 2